MEIRDIRPDDREQWATLFRAYREFYELAPDEAVIERVWAWICDPDHEVSALVATEDPNHTTTEEAGTSRLVGIAHHRRFSRPSSGATGRYLDDLFTTPDARGHGVSTALIEGVERIGAAEGASVVRWITAESNSTARRVYDRVANATSWVTYDRPVTADPRLR